MNRRRGSWFVVTACAIAIYFSHATPSFSSDNTSIQMLPPTDFHDNPCAGTNGGLLQWDGSTPIKCIPNTVGTANGYVGIGTPDPQSLLDMRGGRLHLNAITAQDSFPSSGKGLELLYNNYNAGTAGTGEAEILSWDRSANAALPFQIMASPLILNASPTTGNVGIGTTDPQARLDVNGTIRAGSNGVVIGNSCATEGALGYDITSTVHQPVYCNASLVWAVPPASAELSVSTATLQQYHHGCTNPFTDFMSCSAACSRFCNNGCVNGASDGSCDPISNNNKYATGTLVEWAVPNAACACLH